MKKRGISVIVGYVLLIALAAAMAAGVYSYLEFFVPKENSECPLDLGLIVKEVKCQNGAVNITLINKGLFTADGAFLKIGNSSRIAKTSLRRDKSLDYEIFYESVLKREEQGLAPGESWNMVYEYNGNGTQELEVEPFIFDEENYVVLCQKAVITQDVECN